MDSTDATTNWWNSCATRRWNLHIRSCCEAVPLHQGVLHVARGCSVCLVACSLHFFQTGILVRDGSTLHAQKCSFWGGATAIEMSPVSARVDVKQCWFEDCGQLTGAEESLLSGSDEYGCVQIFDNFADAWPRQAQVASQVALRCSENTFVNNLCYTIVERSDSRAYIDSDRYCLDHNALRGFNGAGTRQAGEVLDANTLYHTGWIH